MADREQPYDPYIPAGGSAPVGNTQNGGNQRTAALQAVSLTSGHKMARLSHEFQPDLCYF